MFYFQHLLNVALSGIDGTRIMSVMVDLAYGILLIGFLIGMYQAAVNGGDVRSLGVTAIKYVVIAIIVANWSAVFHEVNDSFNTLAEKISSSGGVLDMYASWGDQLRAQFQTNPNLTIWDLITGDISGTLITLLLVVAYVIFAVAIVIFCFFYALYGSILYVCGPPVLALLPVLGARDLAKSYAQNVMIWNCWGILYAVFGVMITAIHMDHIDQVLGNGFLGWMKGLADGPLLGLVSIVYALSIALIPVLAKRIVSGDVGSTVGAIAGSVAALVGLAVAGASGISAGSAAAQSATSGASSGAASAGGSAGAAASSAASAPTTPAHAMTLGEAMDAAPSSSPGTPESSPQNSEGRQAGRSSPSRSGRGTAFEQGFYRPIGVMQQVSFQLGKSVGRAMTSRQQATEANAANEG